MCLFFGIFLGILLTVGGSYLADALRKTGAGGGIAEPAMVNWDVVGRKTRALWASIQEQWAKISSKRKDT
jgi:hypothetical protein